MKMNPIERFGNEDNGRLKEDNEGRETHWNGELLKEKCEAEVVVCQKFNIAMLLWDQLGLLCCLSDLSAVQTLTSRPSTG